MIKNSTAFSKWFFILFVAAIVILISAYAIYKHSWTIQKTPTCVSYHFQTNTKEREFLVNNLKQALTGLALNYESLDMMKWSSDISEISLNFSGERIQQEVSLVICEAREGNATLQKIAADTILVQKQIPNSVAMVSIKTQLNAIAYDIPKVDKYYQLHNKIRFEFPLSQKQLENADSSCKQQLIKQVPTMGKTQFECTYP